MMRKCILILVLMVLVVMPSIDVFGAEPIEAQIKQMKDGIAEGGAQRIIDHYNKCWSTDFINLTHTTILNFMNEGSIVIAAFQSQELELLSADCYYCATTDRHRQSLPGRAKNIGISKWNSFRDVLMKTEWNLPRSSIPSRLCI